MREPRELKGWSLLRSLPRMAHNIAEWTSEVAAAYPGEIVRVCLGRSSFLVSSEPSHLEHVLLTNVDNSGSLRPSGMPSMLAIPISGREA
jgi:hypothetical protein